ncbi:Aryl-sulfate sulfotransferase [Lentibacillus sp. JNUCC-1]|uniref:aryl-sulfate sulfotransferase n=1 Tax=Lentibacillus sp. JNUCC-1 TaxID=2654513 RepID=UPI0012E8D8C5|nr:aryl-sulfate sulfotransferase [Lentibacillus sp. JNUCC-1]MUV37880.1 Aryl-sulfate sulfotransferase [Lentibacillus sp. JNUCC-1]
MKQQIIYAERYVNKQKEIDEKLEKGYQKASYTLKKPFVKVDPYGRSPLTALIKFQTEHPAAIEVVVQNAAASKPIRKKWDSFHTEHTIPVLGLQPDTLNEVHVIAYESDGNTESSMLTMDPGPLPNDLPNIELVTSEPNHMENGMTFVVPKENKLFAVDENAALRWYLDMPCRFIFNRLENGNIVMVTKDAPESSYALLLEMDLLGRIEHAYDVLPVPNQPEDFIPHDVIELPSGNLLVTVQDPDSVYEEDHMIEIDRQTGATLNAINLKDVFPRSAYENYDGIMPNQNDWIHINALWYDAKDESVYVSGRRQDAVIKLSYPGVSWNGCWRLMRSGRMRINRICCGRRILM